MGNDTVNAVHIFHNLSISLKKIVLYLNKYKLLGE